jgi:hypothetical protein
MKSVAEAVLKGYGNWEARIAWQIGRMLNGLINLAGYWPKLKHAFTEYNNHYFQSKIRRA